MTVELGLAIKQILIRNNKFQSGLPRCLTQDAFFSACAKVDAYFVVVASVERFTPLVCVFYAKSKNS